MPQVVIGAAAATAIGAGAAWGAAAAGVAGATAWTAGQIATTFAINAALGGASYLLSSKKKSVAPNAYMSDRTVNMRNSICDQRLIYGEVKVGGAITFIDNTYETRTYRECGLYNGQAWFPTAWADNSIGDKLLLCVCLAGHEVEEIGDIYFNDTKMTIDEYGAVSSPNQYQTLAFVWKHTGAADQLADPNLITLCPTKWTSAHRGRGIAYLAIMLRSSSDTYTSGIPTISAVVKGKKVYDPRTATTAYSTNAALCRADFLTDTKFGIGCTYATEIDETYLTAAANICDEDVTLAAGGTEDRYTCNGSIESSQSPADVIEAMKTADSGQIVYSGGLWRIISGAYATPTESALTEDDCCGPINVQTRLSRRDIFNSIRGTYYAPDHDYEAYDFPALESSTYQTEDGGKIWRDISLGFTNSGSMAQRLAKIELLKVRQQMTISLRLKLQAFKYDVGDTILITSTRYGWTEKPFEVQSWKFSLNYESDGPVPCVDIVARETSSTVWDWSTDEESPIDPQPDTNLPSPWDTEDITGLLLAGGDDEVLKTASGAIIPRLKLSWNSIAGTTAGRYGTVQIEYRKNGTTTWISGGSVNGTDDYAFVTVEDQTYYDARVRSVNGFGACGSWAEVDNFYVYGVTEPPDDVAWMTLDGSILKWAMTTVPADLAGYVVRHRAGSTVQWSGAIPAHGGLLTATELDISSIGGGWGDQRVFMVKAVDTTGNESANPGYVVASIPDPSVENAYETIDDKVLTWPGTKTNCTVDGDGNLAADVEESLFWSGSESDAFWTGSDSDLFWNDQIKSATYIRAYTPASDWLGYDAVLQITTTATSYALYLNDGAGWTPFSGRITDLANKEYQIKLVIDAVGASAVVSRWDLICDMPTISEVLENVSIDAGGTRLPIVQTYPHDIVSVQLTVQYDGGNAISARPRDKAESGPLVECLDASGSACAGTVDALVTGY